MLSFSEDESKGKAVILRLELNSELNIIRLEHKA